MEGTHGQLGTGLTDRLRGDDTDGLADVDELAGRHRAAVAGGADTGAGGAGEHGAHLHLRDAGLEQRLDLGVAQVVTALDHDGAVLGHRVLGDRAGVRRGLDVRVADQRTVRLHLGQRHDDATAGAAVGLTDDDVLRDVHQTTGQVTRVGGAQRGIGQTLTSTVGVDEVLQHRQALAERGLDRTRDELTLRVRHQAFMPARLRTCVRLPVAPDFGIMMIGLSAG